MSTSRSAVLRDHVYEELGALIGGGQFPPGEKITIRNLAKDFAMSATPVREVLYCLISEGVLHGEANRSAFIPLLTPQQIAELKDIRLHIECFAAERAALRGTTEIAARLRETSAKLKTARAAGDRRADLALVYKFQRQLYAPCAMPNLIPIINSLWLKTGPYLNLLFPHYISGIQTNRGDWRERIAAGVENRDAAAVVDEVKQSVDQSLTYIAKIVAAAAMLKTSDGNLLPRPITKERRQVNLITIEFPSRR
ncbi:GntR family transcriptional regulator [Rhizobium leguminosarum bv. trifolii]|uniref:GntR family transcriptional regulator n=2 Tax=Rhizobium TaxID=379 RepID=A0A3E1B773_RHILT|nr:MULTISPECIES: GntR family transcriptional regulator [Rhizobium]QAS81169.1 GntR family transcriptional regulator [Rhizobium acidisoli]RFB86836.1 GntR family transcriptional regulator [Rhizobium leguminosarum bv. trifolii]RFB87019.1 GntR family transcriptional regulator [Rhizobium leguminosarum bv. trifolii]